MEADPRHPANADERLFVPLIGGRRLFRTIKVKSVRQGTRGARALAGGVGRGARGSFHVK